MNALDAAARSRPGLKKWSRESYVGNECDTDEYGETQPEKGLGVVTGLIGLGAHLQGHRERVVLLAKAWMAAVDPTERYGGADELRPLLELHHDLLWDRGEHPYDTEEAGDYFTEDVLDEYDDEEAGA